MCTHPLEYQLSAKNRDELRLSTFFLIITRYIHYHSDSAVNELKYLQDKAVVCQPIREIFL